MNTERIRSLNDAFRNTFCGGHVMLTRGVRTLPDNLLIEALARVKDFDAFDKGNDPHNEHDFGAFNAGDQKLFFKIDYYDKRCQDGSPDPANSEQTTRVLTIMLASEY